MNTPDRLAETLSSGKTVGGGRYILNKQIGEHSNTWLAQDEIENKPVVLNFLPLELCQDPRALEELRSQINVIRDLSHPNIGGIYELYEAEGEETFICSEYIEGMNLQGLQQMQPNRVFSWTFLTPLLKQIFAATQFIHENNLIQGSLKPSALMLDRKQQVKLLDVGVSGILNNPLYAGPPQAGMGGLLPYLSPQQIDGNPPAITDDIYSLGITMYEFFTGTVPFNQGDILPQIRNSQPEPIEQRLAKLKISNPIPPIISSMIMECLAKDPTARPQNVETLARSLEVAEMTPVEAPKAAPAPMQRIAPAPVEVLPPESGKVAEYRPASPAKKKPVMAIALIVALLVIAGGGGAWWFLKGGSSNDKKELTKDEKEAIDREKKAADEENKKRNNGGLVPDQPVEKNTPYVETEEEKLLRRRAMEAVELKQLSERSDSALLNLFDGRSLEGSGRGTDGWKGDANYWKVEQGAITLQTPGNAPTGLNTCLVWQGGNVSDFELRFQYKFKLLKANNLAMAGVVYRSKKVKDWDYWGYECRLQYNGDNTGILISRDRTGMISYCQKMICRGTDAGGDKLERVADLEDLKTIQKSINKDDWNDCVITVEGNHMVHKINGHVVADLVDENDKRRTSSGSLAFEVNTGIQPAIYVQFKNIRLKKLK